MYTTLTKLDKYNNLITSNTYDDILQNINKININKIDIEEFAKYCKTTKTSALCKAILKNNYNLTRRLLELKYPINDTIKLENTVTCMCLPKRLKYCNETPLNLTIINNQLDILLLLLQNGAEFKTKDTYMYFQCAIINNNYDMIKLFIDYKLDINVKQPTNHKLIYYKDESYNNMLANYCTDINMLKFLLDNNYDVNKSDIFNYGDTILMNYCSYTRCKNRLNNIKLILQYKPDLRLTNIDNMSAISYAIQNIEHKKTKIKVVKLLLNAGHPINTKDMILHDKNDDHNLIYVNKKGNLSILKLLIKNNYIFNNSTIYNLHDNITRYDNYPRLYSYLKDDEKNYIIKSSKKILSYLYKNFNKIIFEDNIKECFEDTEYTNNSKNYFFFKLYINNTYLLKLNNIHYYDNNIVKYFCLYL